MGDPLATAGLVGDVQSVLEEAARQAAAACGARTVAVGLVDPPVIAARVWEVAAGSLGSVSAVDVPLSAAEPMAAAVRTGGPVDGFGGWATSALARADLAVPLAAGGDAIGAIGVGGVEETNGLVPRLERIAARTFLAVEHVELRRRSRSALHETVTVLAALIEGRDAYTESHCVHLAEMSLAIGVRMGLADERLERLSFGGLLHDIGKIAVPDSILTKPAALTDSEFEEMKAHAAVGEQILGRIGSLAPVAPIVGQHHERFDGSGYPRGLRGDSILPEARILAVVDTFDAMTTARPYRAALPWSTTTEEIASGAGTQFDPDVVEVFLRYMTGEEAQWKKSSPT